MRTEFNPGKRLWNGAAAGIGVLGTATSVILKTLMKSGYTAYVIGRTILTDAKDAVEEVAAEARAEIHAEKKGPRSRQRKQGLARARKAQTEEIPIEGIKPGTAAPASGQYREVGPRGGRKEREVEVEKGSPLPPTTTKGSTYTLVDPDDDKSEKGM